MSRPNDVTGYGYDLMGRPTSITYPSGAIARHAYHRGKVRSLTMEPVAGTVVNVATGIGHQPFDDIGRLTCGNGLKRLQGFQQSLTYAWTASDQVEAMRAARSDAQRKLGLFSAAIRPGGSPRECAHPPPR